MARLRVCVVCLGNICRSPLGEAVLRERAAANGLSLEIDSAGTGGWHVGELPDSRAVDAGARIGLDLTDQRARQLNAQDLEEFDWILAMDRSNLQNIQRLGTGRARVALFLPDGGEVPDPYTGEDGDFDAVVQMLIPAADRWITVWKSSAP